MLRTAYILATVSLLGCGPKATTPPVSPTAEEPDAGDALSESRSTVVGCYRELNVKQKADGVPRYVGRVVLVLENGDRVLLETHDEGIRPADEIETFRDRKVSVVAAELTESCQAWGDEATASIVGPCLRGIESIELTLDEQAGCD